VNAADIFERFEARPHVEVITVRARWPDNPRGAGVIRELHYRSDKWHPGTVQDYWHPFETRVSLLADERDRRWGRGGRRRRAPVPPRREVAVLGDVLFVIWRAPDGREHILDLEAGPELGDSPRLVGYHRGGRDHLAVFPLTTRPWAFVITGGGLEIRPEGIVG